MKTKVYNRLHNPIIRQGKKIVDDDRWIGKQCFKGFDGRTAKKDLFVLFSIVKLWLSNWLRDCDQSDAKRAIFSGGHHWSKAWENNENLCFFEAW